MGAQMIGSSGKHGEQRCRCASCDRDVRRNIPAAFVALKFTRVKSPRSGTCKEKLRQFGAVCSEICAQRLRHAGHWEFQPLGMWLGPNAFRQYENVVATFWMSRDLREQDIPDFLHAITVPPRPTVMKIRPEIRDIICEAKEVLCQ